jgi:hypothetical protein
MANGTKRKNLNISSPAVDILTTMAEGNPGAIRVLTELMRKQSGMETILNLDDMNIRGGQIWIAYSDYADSDLGKLIVAASQRKAELVAMVNQECAAFGEIAVVAGAVNRR